MKEANPSTQKSGLENISVQRLNGVGPKLAEKLSLLGINSIQDILFHLPLRYQDRSRITAIGALQPGTDAVIEGEIRAADIAFGRRRSLLCRIQDGTGTVTLRFFHFSSAQKDNLKPGTRLRCYGEARRGASGLEFYHPEYLPLEGNAPIPIENSLTPIYPTSEGLNQTMWRKLSKQALTYLEKSKISELVPSQAIPKSLHISLQEALDYIHRPPTDAPQEQLREGHHPLQQRLAFEELLAHNLSLLQLRQEIRHHGAPAFKQHGIKPAFLQQLGFTLTNAQQRVAAEVDHDLGQHQPMLRLIQGDVGSGKTVVAALAALRAIASGYQVAIMAPTEILAEQHFYNFEQWLAPLKHQQQPIQIAWLTGKVKGKLRQQQLARIAEHKASVIIGTHALFQDDVTFAKLGLIIIDEQHRFGVHQRLALKKKAAANVGHPHQLIMTATPIPRTLAMSAYADLDTSVIDELPPGRTPVNTVVIDNARRTNVMKKLHDACNEGRQAYWVCTLIEESETLEAKAAEDSHLALQAALPGLRIGLIHGRMKSPEKADIMRAFKAHHLDVLVATTVIEVGVDVPNASLMIIENAERLGLAQLHQLRGRVGRGKTASHCVLMYQAPLSQLGKERLHIMRENSDGFVIAEKDLTLRGPGELLGTRQTGLMQLKIADLTRDSHLLAEVGQSASIMLANHAGCVAPLIKRWLSNNEQYAQV